MVAHLGSPNPRMLNWGLSEGLRKGLYENEEQYCPRQLRKQCSPKSPAHQTILVCQMTTTNQRDEGHNVLPLRYVKSANPTYSNCCMWNAKGWCYTLRGQHPLCMHELTDAHDQLVSLLLTGERQNATRFESTGCFCFLELPEFAKV